MSGRVETQKTIADGDFVEGSSLFVPKKCVRNPYFVPAAFSKAHISFFFLLVRRREYQAFVFPQLAEVHADRIILGKNKSSSCGLDQMILL